MMINDPISEQILSVFRLNHLAKQLLEQHLGAIYVEGEVSNLSVPSSGHAYFSLKDDKAQIRCAFFKGYHSKDSIHLLSNGAKLLVSGKLSLYEPRGDYQLIAERIAPVGIGDLFQQFEALKKKLESSGLFASKLKKSWPKYPSNIALITSPTGAAVHDMLTTLKRRFPLTSVFIYPCEVQGINAPSQLIQAIQQANQNSNLDLILLARGGGSIEDLWAFNDEALAYAMAHSVLPIISGIGHETDFTIADFVADFRAPTPTAAAEAAVPDIRALLSHVDNLNIRYITATERYLSKRIELIIALKNRLSSPKQLLMRHWQTLDGLYAKFKHQFHQIELKKQTQLQKAVAKLETLSPLSTLSRGYSIASNGKNIIKQTSDAPVTSHIQLVLHQGQLKCQVIEHVD